MNTLEKSKSTQIATQFMAKCTADSTLNVEEFVEACAVGIGSMIGLRVDPDKQAEVLENAVVAMKECREIGVQFSPLADLLRGKMAPGIHFVVIQGNKKMTRGNGSSANRLCAHRTGWALQIQEGVTALATVGAKSNLMGLLESTLDENEKYIGSEPWDALESVYNTLDKEALELETELEEANERIEELENELEKANDRIQELLEG